MEGQSIDDMRIAHGLKPFNYPWSKIPLDQAVKSGIDPVHGDGHDRSADKSD